MATKYAYYDTGDDAFLLLTAGGMGSPMPAQTFTPTVTHELKYFRFKGYRPAGGTTGLTCYVYSDFTGQYSVTWSLLPKLATATTPNTDIPETTADWFSCTLDTPIIVTAGVKYTIYFLPEASMFNIVRISIDQTSSSYAGGSYMYLGDWAEVVPWTAVATTDVLFEEWGDPLDASAIVVPLLNVNCNAHSPKMGMNTIIPLPSLNVAVQPLTAYELSTLITVPLLEIDVALGQSPTVKNFKDQPIRNGGLYMNKVVLPNYVYAIGLQKHTTIPIYDEATDPVKIAQDGEIIFPYREAMMYTQEMTTIVANIVLAKFRFQSNNGKVDCLPHVGLEMWDVYQFDDATADQVAALSRVSGYELIWDPPNNHYNHRMMFTEV